MSEKENYLNKSVINAFKIIECFDRENSLLTSQEISEMTDLNPSYAWRLILTLEHCGYLKQCCDGKRYRLHLKGLSLARVILNTFKVRLAALPHLQELSQEVKMNTSLGVLDNDEIVYVIRIPSPSVPDVYSHIGKRAPLYCTALGKILLASLPDEERDELISQINFVKLTSNTIDNEEELINQIEKIKEQKYALDDSEYYSDAKCLAVPLSDNTGKAIAAISISNRYIHNEQRDVMDYLSKLSKTSDKISHQLGCSLFDPFDRANTSNNNKT